MMGLEGPLDRLRRPEYTGENRCFPCTAVNTAIAVVVAVAVGYAVTAVTGSFVGTAVGGTAFTISLAAIYLRGYLVPGTPSLTKRYFPDWLLGLFDKDPRDTGGTEGGAGTGIDVEGVLLSAGLLAEQPHGDLGLTATFREAWRDRIVAERGRDTGAEALADVLDTDAEAVRVEEFAGGSFVGFHEGRRVGNWPSRAAFVADAAAAAVLPQFYDGWGEDTPAERGELLAGLRLFVEQCPSCDARVTFGQEVVESCCRSYDVVAVTCEDCEQRVFEVDASNLDPQTTEAAR